MQKTTKRTHEKISTTVFILFICANSDICRDIFRNTRIDYGKYLYNSNSYINYGLFGHFPGIRDKYIRSERSWQRWTAAEMRKSLKDKTTFIMT